MINDMARKIPLRKCIGCGELKDKRELVRIVKTKDNNYFLDKTGKANGRGAYLCDDSKCFNLALKNNGFERSFKTSIPNEFIDIIKKEFESNE